MHNGKCLILAEIADCFYKRIKIKQQNGILKKWKHKFVLSMGINAKVLDTSIYFLFAELEPFAMKDFSAKSEFEFS